MNAPANIKGATYVPPEPPTKYEVLARYIQHTPQGERTEALRELIKLAAGQIAALREPSYAAEVLAELAGELDERRAA